MEGNVSLALKQQTVKLLPRHIAVDYFNVAAVADSVSKLLLLGEMTLTIYRFYD